MCRCKTDDSSVFIRAYLHPVSVAPISHELVSTADTAEDEMTANLTGCLFSP